MSTMNASQMAERHTVEELLALQAGVIAEPLSPRQRRRLTAIGWAITYRMCKDKGQQFEAATFNNYRTRRD